jgi:hypothetical protein
LRKKQKKVFKTTSPSSSGHEDGKKIISPHLLSKRKVRLLLKEGIPVPFGRRGWKIN